MKLKDLSVGDKVSLEIEIKGEVDAQKFEFSSEVSLNMKDYIFIEPVRIDDKVVGFSSDNIFVNFILIRENKMPMIWRKINIITVSYKGNTYYRVYSKDHGIEINRRSSFRLYVGLDAIVQVGINNKAIEVIVKDVSEGGFSFVADRDFSEVHHKSVRMVFSDMGRTFSLNGIVVRKEEITEGKFVYGCQLNIKNQLLNRYINEKQREIIAKRNERVTDSKGAWAVKDLNAKIVKKESQKSERYQSSVKNDIGDIDKADRRDLFKEK